MDDDHSRRVLRIFQDVVELGPDGREAALTRACGDDRGLRADVVTLLAAHDEEDTFLERPAVLEPAAGWRRDGLLGKRLGHTLITRVISSGGMGIVYEAVQENPRRMVAVKVLRQGFPSRSALKRFQYEAQVLGRLHHPGIAQVYEAGIHATEDGVPGVPYLVMEHVAEARSITEFARVQGLDVEQRLCLFMEVCEAVHHGHQKGIIHRDLKPGNILVGPDGKVKVIDFGLARATDSDMTLASAQTEVGQLVGTLQYMSPEQCLADPHDLDIRSDVYALGVVLYQLLCDRLPYDLRDLPLVEALRRVREEPPARPSTTMRTLRGDLEAILLKTLEKDRQRRYESAHELRRDLERFLRREPISAHAPTVFYQLRTFASRNRTLVAGVAGVFLALVLGLAASTWLYLQAESARTQLDQEAEMVRQVNAFFTEMLASLDPLQLEAGATVTIPAPFVPGQRTGYARDVSMAEMLRWAVPRIEHTFAGKPEQEARVHETIGMAFFRLGMNHEARPQLEAALALRSATLGEDHEDILRSKVQLADVLRWLGEYAAVESLLRPALDELTHLLGDEDWQTQSCALVLAAALGHQGRTAEAHQIFEEVHRVQLRTLGEEDRRTVWTMGEWAYELARHGQGNEAEALANRALEISRRVFGTEDYLTCLAGGVVGFQLALRGEFARGEALMRPALEARRRLSGENHPRTGLAKFILAMLLRGEQSLQEREQLYREILDGWRRNLGEGHVYVAVATGRYAELLADRRRHEALEALLRERFEACRSDLGDEDGRTAGALQVLATFLLDRGRPDEGEALYRALLRSRREKLGDDVPETLAGLKLLADYHLQSGRVDAAVTVLEDWVHAKVRAHGETHPATLSARTAAAVALAGAGRTEQAGEQAAAARAGWRRRTEGAEGTANDLNELAWLLLTAEPPELRDPAQARSAAEEAVKLSESDDATVLDTLALALELTGEPARAIETQRRAVATLGPGSSALRDQIEGNLVRMLLRHGDDRAAEKALDDTMARKREQFGEGHIGLARWLQDQVLLLLEADRPDLAEPRAREALRLWVRHAAGDPSWNLACTMTLHGRCLARLGRLDEAEPLLSQGLEGLQDVPLAEAIEARERARSWLADLDAASGRPGRAAAVEGSSQG